MAKQLFATNRQFDTNLSGQEPKVFAKNILQGDHAQAAQFKPCRVENDNHPENELFQRSGIHTLFDLGLLWIKSDRLQVKLHPSFSRYSCFDSGLYRNVDAMWHFSQENATSHDLQMAALESRPL